MCTGERATDVAIGPIVCCTTWRVGASRVATACAVLLGVASPLRMAATCVATTATVGALGGAGGGLHATTPASQLASQHSAMRIGWDLPGCGVFERWRIVA